MALGHSACPLSLQDADLGQSARDIHELVAAVVEKLCCTEQRSAELLRLLHALRQRTTDFIKVWGVVTDSEVATDLDRDGSQLYNAARKLVGDAENNGLPIALARSSAAMLIYAGTIKPYTPADCSRLVRVLSKAASNMMQLGATYLDEAEQLLCLAAGFHRNLKSCDQGATRDKSFFDFYRVKYTYGVAKKNDDVAEFDLTCAVEDLLTLSEGTPPILVFHDVADLCVQHGAKLMQAASPQDSQWSSALQKTVQWLREGLKLLERVEAAALPQILDLQAAALRHLSRASLEWASVSATDQQRRERFLSAEAALDELSKLSPAWSRDERVSMLRLDILVKSKAPSRQILDFVTTLYARPDLSSDAVNCILALASAHRDQLDFLRNTVEPLLVRLVRTQSPADQESAKRVLLTVVRVANSPPALQLLNDQLEYLAGAHFEIGEDAGTIAQLLLWRHGDAFSERKELVEAANFYHTAAHRLFASLERNAAKSARRAALCWLESGRTEMAQRALLSCPRRLADDALNHHISFSILCEQRREEDALRAFEALLGASNFKTTMLASVVQSAQAARFGKVIRLGLQSIIERTKGSSALDFEIDSVVLTRCLVKYQLPAEGASFTADTAATLLDSLRHNLSALKKAIELDSSDEKLRKECAWTFKVAFNAAVHISSTVSSAAAAEMFDLCVAVAQCREKLETITDTEFHRTKVWSKLSCLVGRALAAKEGSMNARELKLHWFKFREEVKEAWALLEHTRAAINSSDAMPDVQCALSIFEFEANAMLEDWAGARDVFQRVSGQPFTPLVAWRSIAELSWSSATCPDELLHTVMEQTVQVYRENLKDDNGVVQLSRWVRAVLVHLMTLCRHPDALSEACKYIQVALDVIEKHPGAVAAYPEEEKASILDVAWEKALSLHAMGHELAKRFAQYAIAFGSYGGCSAHSVEWLKVQYSSWLEESAENPHPATEHE